MSRQLRVFRRVILFTLMNVQVLRNRSPGLFTTFILSCSQRPRFITFSVTVIQRRVIWVRPVRRRRFFLVAVINSLRFGGRVQSGPLRRLMVQISLWTQPVLTPFRDCVFSHFLVLILLLTYKIIFLIRLCQLEGSPGPFRPLVRSHRDFTTVLSFMAWGQLWLLQARTIIGLIFEILTSPIWM